IATSGQSQGRYKPDQAYAEPAGEHASLNSAGLAIPYHDLSPCAVEVKQSPSLARRQRDVIQTVSIVYDHQSLTQRRGINSARDPSPARQFPETDCLSIRY